MSKTNDPAFPAPMYIIPKDLLDEGVREVGRTSGMTLRDWFAGQALAYMGTLRTPKGAAQEAYKTADAMIKQREEK